jgi:FlaA1/EpsC-like NDP-sugar epimerase
MNVAGQKILIFGGTGSLGRALIRRLSADNQLILFSRDEAKHWTIKNQLEHKDNVKFVVGDIRDSARVEESLIRFNPTAVIIASALKQVDTCELSPFESVQTNILGIRNIVDAVTRQADRLTALDAVLMVSTDKACAPANVYGMCKAVAERLVTSECIAMERPRFVGVRYGNVLESRGSIIPLFRHQGEYQSHFTVTHPEMTRFIMTLDQSIDLIISTILGAKSGEMWLPKLKAMNIMDLAEIFSERYGKPIKIVGIRPGEKLHEDLISRPESIRVRDEGGFYKMNPAHCEIPMDAKIFDYASNQDVLPKQELAAYLDQLGIFTRSMDQFLGREIEEIKTSN